jgi:DMSO/TMAO reductase YedYZ molybdopterin-dependent catalytic subunit
MAETDPEHRGERSPGADRLPPGQRLHGGWPVLHYGPVPRFKPDLWTFQIVGATASGEKHQWTYPEFGELPMSTVRGDFHCVTKFSMLDNEWRGVVAADLFELAPPADDVTHVLVFAEYGFSTNLRIDDLLRPNAIFATHRNGERLTPDHGFPLRLVVPHLYAWKGPKWVRGFEYMVGDRRGFWEERGYHNVGDPWQEQRYSYQEDPSDGPAL